MKINGCLDAVLLVFTIAKVWAKEPELPLCPSNMPFFPQNLPMHCRMPAGGYPVLPAPQQMPTMAPFPPEYYKSPSPDKVPGPIPFPIPSGVPGLPPGFPPGFPGLPPGMLGPGPMPMPMPLPAPGPAHKLPVIVMPFYSPDPSYKKRQSSHSHRDRSNRYIEMYTRSPYDSDTNRAVDIFPEMRSYDSNSHKRIIASKIPYEGAEPNRIVEIHRRSHNTGASYDTSRDTSVEGEGFWKSQRGFRRNGRRKNRKHKSKRRRYPKKELLTPILQYVTKDGYVIFEKKISKDEAKDWLSMKKEEQKIDEPEEADLENVNKNNDTSEQVNNDNNEMNEDVEILDGHKDKSKEKVAVQPPRAPKRQNPHKLRNHHTKEEKQKGPS